MLPIKSINISKTHTPLWLRLIITGSILFLIGVFWLTVQAAEVEENREEIYTEIINTRIEDTTIIQNTSGEVIQAPPQVLNEEVVTLTSEEIITPPSTAEIVIAKVTPQPSEIDSYVRMKCAGSCSEERIAGAVANGTILYNIAVEYGVNPMFLVALGWHESGLVADRTNCANYNGTCDIGIMQWNDVHLQRIDNNCRLNVECSARFAASDIKYGKEGQWCALPKVYADGYTSGY